MTRRACPGPGDHGGHATREARGQLRLQEDRLRFCLLLAAQYGLQPFLKVFIADGVSKVSLVLGTELAKVLIGVVGMLLDGSLASNFAGWNPRGAAFAVIPSLIYAAQNYLLVFGYQSMDSITFNCLNQSSWCQPRCACTSCSGPSRASCRWLRSRDYSSRA